MINSGGYDPKGQFIIANIAFKANDKVAKSNPAKVPNNEMTWQAFASAAKTKTPNLKVIFLRDIQNVGMWAIAQTNYQEASIGLDQVAVWDQSTPQKKVWFDRFMGSDNANGKLLALTNHHGGEGNKQVAKIITITKQAAGSQGKFTAALMLA